jgi:hypothetical protein
MLENLEPSDHGRPAEEGLQATLYMGELRDTHEFPRAVKADEIVDPGESRNIRDAVFLTRDPGLLGKLPVDHP